MSGKRVKALRREFVKTFGRAPNEAVKEGETRRARWGHKVISWLQMTVVQKDEFRAFRKAHRRAA